MIPKSIEWVGDSDGFLRLIDQTQLPRTLAYRDCRTVEDVWEAIKKSARPRGAGHRHRRRLRRRRRRAEAAAGWVEVGRLPAHQPADGRESLLGAGPHGAGRGPAGPGRRLLDEALAIHEEDRRMCHAIGRAGAALIGDGSGVLTHCNTGGLATAEYGTALSVLFTAADQGRRFHVFADETRPLLQGARLTTWELQQAGMDVTLICDSMAAQVMKEGRVQLVIVGADRIAANGDTANKIGTYGVAVLAKAHDIPFYVAAPSSTFDLKLANGDGIPIEQRDPREVTHGFGKQTAPDGVAVYNPAFDVTPARLIAGLVTEKGLIQPVTEAAIRERLGS